MAKAKRIVLSLAAVTAIAMTCHSANAAFCRSLGDNSQVPWDQAPDWQRDSVVNGVQFVLANPDAGDQASHENWMKVKEAEGWKYGEIKDPEKKEHPCFLPYDKLPPEQQFKDALFRAIVLGAAGGIILIEAPLPDPIIATQAGEIGELKGQVELLEADLKKALTATKRAQAKAAKVAELPKVAQPRKIGVMKQGLEIGFLEELLKADDATFTVVASNGKKEVIAIAPRQVEGEIWTRRKAGIVLTQPITVLGPPIGQPAAHVEGFALLDDKGEQIAWAPLTQEVRIPPQQEMRFKDLAFA